MLKRISFSAFTVVVTITLFTHVVQGQNACYSNTATDGYQIPVESLENSSSAYGLCKEGWFCPFYDPNDIEGTWPHICPASDSCVELRINNEFCEPQGPREPTPCKGGFYCPVSNQMLRCPDGYWCPLGCTKPHKCSPFAYCPEGTSNEYNMVGILVVVLVDVAIVICVVLYRRMYRADVQQDQVDLDNEDEMVRINQAKAAAENAGTSENEWGALKSDGDTRKDLQPLFNLFSKARQGGSSVTIRFSDLSVKIPAKDVAGQQPVATSTSPTSPLASPPETPRKAAPGGGGENQPKQDKTLLRGANGKFRPGTVTAIMGPSGAGKTVLLNTLLNKNASSWIQEGALKVNHTLSVTDIRHVVGFVPQDDVLHPDLTVEQNLYYSAETRLPPSFTPEEKDLLRSEIVKALGLSVARHVRIGDESSRGVSGGQRKRCSIGVELAACPTALFLDEPTTGLDAATALDLCSLLQRLSIGTQSTIAMVIHQPRVEIWNALDQVLLLAPGGRTVFQGAQADAKNYFEASLGLNFEVGNPADIILDGIAAQADVAVDMWDARMELLANGATPQLPQALKLSTAPPLPPLPPVDTPPLGHVEGDEGDAVEKCAQVEDSITAGQPTREEGGCGGGGVQKEADEDTAVVTATIPPPRGASFGKQVFLASHRQLVKINSNVTAAIMDVMLGTFCCIVMATAKIREDYLGVIDGGYALVAPKHKLYTLPMICMFYMLAIASGVAPGGIRTFGSAMPLYWREASSGHNKLAYFLGYSLIDLFRTVVSSLHFAVVAYLMAEPLQSFWMFWMWMMLLFICVDSQSAALSMFLKPDTAPILSTIVAIFMGLFNGYASIPVIGPVSYAWWSTEGLLNGEIMPVSNIWSVDVLEEMAPNPGWNLDQVGVDAMALVIIYLVYRAAAFGLLIGLNREKQR